MMPDANAAAPAPASRTGWWPSWAAAVGETGGDTAWALLEQGTALVASVVSFLLLGRPLGPAGYGAFVGLYALMGPFLALSQAGVFLAAMEHVVREREEAADVARSCLGITAANALVCVPILSAVGVHWIPGLSPLTAVLLVGAEFCLNGALATAGGMVQAVIGFRPAARLRTIGSLSRVALLSGLSAAGALTLSTLAVGQVFTLGAVALFGMAKLSRRLGVIPRPGRIRRAHFRSVLLYGLGISGSMAQGDGDKFVLNAASHQADAGRYGAAYRIIGILQLPLGALSGATHISFLQVGCGPYAQSRRAIRLSLISLAYAIPAVAATILLAPLIPVILSKAFSESTLILQLLTPVVILRGVVIYPMNGLLGLGRNALRTKLQLGNALVALALYAALIPRYSWRGALVATLVSESLLCASGWVGLYRCERELVREAGAART
jgi:O-antigen/teichoic acid export membrane protein